MLHVNQGEEMKLLKATFCIALALGIPTTICLAAPAKLPVWSPAKALSAQLMPAVTIDKYQIQPPKGYVPLPSKSGPNGSTANAWGGLIRADGTRPYLMVFQFSVPAEEGNKYTLQQISAKMLASVEQRRKNWNQSTPEQGTINGITFIRTYWQGTDVTNGRPMHGFNYLGKDGDTLLQLSSQDLNQHQKIALPVAEASALTFKKQ
jgi:hypothetical protein